jgi:hypothetical protein
MFYIFVRENNLTITFPSYKPSQIRSYNNLIDIKKLYAMFLLLYAMYIQMIDVYKRKFTRTEISFWPCN